MARNLKKIFSCSKVSKLSMVKVSYIGLWIPSNLAWKFIIERMILVKVNWCSYVYILIHTHPHMGNTMVGLKRNFGCAGLLSHCWHIVYVNVVVEWCWIAHLASILPWNVCIVIVNAKTKGYGDASHGLWRRVGSIVGEIKEDVVGSRATDTVTWTVNLSRKNKKTIYTMWLG